MPATAEPSYTVFIRLPFPRGEFVDPPAVEWDASKDKALWKILSKASKNSDLKWSELADKLEVTLPFLLQQVAWLYERQLLQVRAQMRKVGVSKSGASPVPGSTSESGGEAMRRTGSGGGQFPRNSQRHKLIGVVRVPSSLSYRKDSPIPKDSSISTTPRATVPPFPRTPSTNAAPQVRNAGTSTSPHQPHSNLARRSLSPIRPSRPSPQPEPEPLSPALSPASSASSSSSESPAQSRLLRRPPRFKTNKKVGRSDAPSSSDEEEPAFLPFANSTNPHPETLTNPHDPSATLRGDPRNIGRKAPTQRKLMEADQQSTTSDSSASSAAPLTRGEELARRGLTPLSPRRTAELAGRSPGFKGKGVAREGSDGTPSMGSSFSDLEDASVTQSALEEALASNMQAGGGMASRMSSISKVLRSKYYNLE
ncbi:hypothetical protein B7494_g2166 [Chlorociboria aeruginascens]|nr:hypothetical protein B7494_g2166 [Chlorociboria aeruginascens]